MLEDTSLALQLLEDHGALSARDALHAAVMKNHGIEVIATFDKDFDAVAGIRRYRFAR
jgi:predicted nucleic acid-binding protein